MHRQLAFQVMFVVMVGLVAASTAAAQSPPVDEKSYAELVAENYVLLSRAESQRLVRFAAAFRNCVAKHGVRVGAPHVAKTRITMAVPAGTDRSRLNRLGGVCGTALGGPPKGSSLQTQQRYGNTNAVVLYLPRRCLIDPKVAAS